MTNTTQPEVTQADAERHLIELIIHAYHTTRLGDAADHILGKPYVRKALDRLSHSTPADQEPVAIEAECARLLAAYLRKEIGRLMQQAEHWSKNGHPFAVHHRVTKADAYFQILCLMERDPEKGWKLPFDEIRAGLERKPIYPAGDYPPNADLHRYRDPAFVVAAAGPASPPTPSDRNAEIALGKAIAFEEAARLIECRNTNEGGRLDALAIRTLAKEGAVPSVDRNAVLVKVLEATLKEARTANKVIALNRDGGGQGRIKVATAMHRIERELEGALESLRNEPAESARRHCAGRGQNNRRTTEPAAQVEGEG